ncbi:DUF4396 domain-containing protein [Nocardioides sp.]|uniref:DUF4396 domain-containing protein n=1 Tax=Nocardioides sp. TaxID=35761 RepID=UPI00356A225D
MTVHEHEHEHGVHDEHIDHAGHADHSEHAGHDQHASTNAMAASATLHCLTGCAIGEILGLMIGTAIGLATLPTIALAIALAFLFGYALSTLPLLKTGLGFAAALSIVLAADTLSILTMEITDNAVMAIIPGAMDAGLVNPIYWVGMAIALSAAFVAAYPVNRYLLQRGKGHALTHEFHGADAVQTGWRRFIPALASTTLAAVIASFILGGLVVSVADELGDESTTSQHSN